MKIYKVISILSILILVRNFNYNNIKINFNDLIIFKKVIFLVDNIC